MNFAWFSQTSRFAAVTVALAATGTLAWTGCGSSNNGSYCDSTGCYTCDGYGCSSTGTLDAGGPTFDAGTHPGADAGTKEDAKGDAKPDARSDAKTDAGTKPDAKADAKPVCGGTNGPCACTKTSDCTSGEECVAGACQPASDVCQYSSQCLGSDVCE